MDNGLYIYIYLLRLLISLEQHDELREIDLWKNRPRPRFGWKYL